MEPYHGRRGKESGGVCGMNRAHPTMLLMVAMVATMAVVLLCESPPLVASGVAQSPVLKLPGNVVFEELANSYESRPFLRNYFPAERTNEGSADLTESNVTPIAEETESETILEASPVVEDEPREGKPKSSDADEALIEVSNISSSNQTLVEPEETSLAEEEATLAGKETTLAKNATSDSTLTAEEKSELFLETEETMRPDGLLLDADLDARPTLKSLEAPLSADASILRSKAAMNSTTAMEDEATHEADAVTITHMTGSKAVNSSTAIAEGEADAAAIAQETGSKVATNATTAMEDEAEGGSVAEAILEAMGSKAMNSTTAMEDDGEVDAEAITPKMRSKAVNSTTALEGEGEGDAEAIAQQTAESEESRGEQSKCDYSVGKWVLDETRPLYSGLECKMWLSPGFSCRLNNHPDKLLDRYRWQPAGCDLPEFNASSVLEMLRNKVVAFVGDSLGRQQLQSLLCMLTRGKNDTAITDIGTSFGFYTPRGERKPNGFAFRFDATNTTIMYKWSVTLARIQPLNRTDPGTRNALHLDRPEEFIEKHLPVIDVLVLNSGHHWNNGKMKQNRFDFYLDGKPVKKSEEVSKVPFAYNVTVHNVVRWMHNATKATPEKIVFYRSLSPRHFRNGDWNTGGTCDTITFGKDKQMQEGTRVDPNAESAVIGTTVNLLNITSLSLERGETHVSKYGGGTGGQDCLHWCLPGIPDTWNEIFFADLATKLKRRGVGSNRS